MRKSTAAIIMVFAISHLMLSACKKTETPRARMTPEQAQQLETVKKAYAAEKKAVAARINGEAITNYQLMREMIAITPRYLTPGQEQSPELFQKIYTIALERLIFRELAVQDAKKRGMTAAPAIIDEELKKLKAKAGSEDAYREYLGNNGLTEPELRASLERQYLLQMVLAHELYAKVSVTDAALRQRYKKDRKGLVTNDAVRRQLSFEEAKGLLSQRITAEAVEKKRQEWDRELRKNARIEIMEQQRKQG